MAARLSIVIPTLNAAETLPATLAALVEGLEAGLIRDLVISDGGSTDATGDIADAAGATWVSGAPSRGGQLRRGCGAARGDWLLVLHADTRPDPGWSRAVAAHVAQGQGAGYFGLAFDATGLPPALVAGWANLRAAVFGLPYGDQGLLVARADLDRAGGYPDQPLMEDVALVRALARAGVPLRRLPVRAVTSAQRYAREGWLRRGARNLGTLARYAAGADPARLAERYRR